MYDYFDNRGCEAEPGLEGDAIGGVNCGLAVSAWVEIEATPTVVSKPGRVCQERLDEDNFFRTLAEELETKLRGRRIAKLAEATFETIVSNEGFGFSMEREKITQAFRDAVNTGALAVNELAEGINRILQSGESPLRVNVQYTVIGTLVLRKQPVELRCATFFLRNNDTNRDVDRIEVFGNSLEKSLPAKPIDVSIVGCPNSGWISQRLRQWNLRTPNNRW